VSAVDAKLAAATASKDPASLSEALAAASALGLTTASSGAFHTATMTLGRLQGEASALDALDLALASG